MIVVFSFPYFMGLCSFANGTLLHTCAAFCSLFLYFFFSVPGNLIPGDTRTSLCFSSKNNTHCVKNCTFKTMIENVLQILKLLGFKK